MEDLHQQLKIMCMQHCQKDVNIFYFHFPRFCPACKQDLAAVQLRIPPFVLPCPFSSAEKCPCSVVVKPTNGDFLRTYENGDNLHIAVTDSNGTTFEYDENGLKVGCGKDWKQCIGINILDDFSNDRSGASRWDFKLNEVCQLEQWTAHLYEEHSHNCFSFVMAVLKSLDLLNVASMDKVKFCREFVLPKTTHASKYISLYRKLHNEGVVYQT